MCRRHKRQRNDRGRYKNDERRKARQQHRLQQRTDSQANAMTPQPPNTVFSRHTAEGITTPSTQPSQETSFSIGGVYETLDPQYAPLSPVYSTVDQPSQVQTQSVYFPLQRPAEPATPSVYARMDQPRQAASSSMYARLGSPTHQTTPSVYATLDQSRQRATPSVFSVWP